jgi:hypothetical protein
LCISEGEYLYGAPRYARVLVELLRGATKSLGEKHKKYHRHQDIDNHSFGKQAREHNLHMLDGALLRKVVVKLGNIALGTLVRVIIGFKKQLVSVETSV